MAFPQNFMDELTARNDIVEVVSGYVPLKKRGKDYWACCPFHSEKTPSFHVQPDEQFYYCFGCKKGGGVINFIMEEENLSFPEAVRFLAKRAGMEVPDDREDRQEAARRKRLLDLNRDAARFYYHQLLSPEGAAVRDYLTRRRIGRKTAVKFGMGAAGRGWDTLLNAMEGQGYSRDELYDAGLVVTGKDGRFRDKFYNRLMLPVIDTRGDVVGFGSRVLDKSEPKYMNTPDTPVYSKRRVLYGLNLARRTKRKNIILCEGNLDVVTLHQAGFDNAAASMGTALTPDQVRLLARFTKELVLCYDNDSAGKTATARALDILNGSGLEVRVLQLPRRRTEDGELVKQDPDDFIKFHGADAFERLLMGSENGTDFRMEEIAAKYDLQTDEGRLKFSAEARELIASLESSVEREIYTGRAAELAGVPREVMDADAQRAAKRRYAKEQRAEIRKAVNPSTQSVQPDDRSLRYDNVRSALAEEGVVRLLLKDDGIFPAAPPLKPEEFTVPLLGKAYAYLWKLREEKRPLSLGALSGELTPEEMSHLAAVYQKPESAENAPRALADYIKTIRTEAGRRSGGAGDPADVLAATVEKYKRSRHKGGTA